MVPGDDFSHRSVETPPAGDIDGRHRDCTGDWAARSGPWLKNEHSIDGSTIHSTSDAEGEDHSIMVPRRACGVRAPRPAYAFDADVLLLPGPITHYGSPFVLLHE
jgi:hypothetical protein